MSNLNLLRKQRKAPASSDPMNDGYTTLKELSSALSKTIDAVSTFELAKAGQMPNLTRGIDFYAEVERFEMTLIKYALIKAKGSQKRAARLLGLKPTTLSSKIKSYHLDWKTIKQVQPGLVIHDHT